MAEELLDPFWSVAEVPVDELPRRERRPLVVELLLPVVLCPIELLPVLLGEPIWSLPVVDCPVALVPLWPVAETLPAGFADVGDVGSVVVPAVGGGALDGILDGDDCAYANAPPARTVLNAIELILSNFVELIVFPSLG